MAHLFRTKMDKVKWSTLLESAFVKPGQLNAAYHAFHNFSFHNSMLAMFQCASRDIPIGPLNTYKGWQKLGRQVRKGEHAICLWRPIDLIRSRKDEETGEDEKYHVTGFVIRPFWFALAQTDGSHVKFAPLPDWDREKALRILDIKVMQFISQNGNALGYTDLGTRQIAINPTSPTPYTTLFHEIAHILLDHGKTADCIKGDRAQGEVEAEAVALLCVDALGIVEDVSSCRAYIQHWSNGARAVHEAIAKRIFDTVENILKAGITEEQNGSV